MQALLRRLLERSKQKIDRSAAGTPVPAGIDPAEQRGPTAHERTLMRRRQRALRCRRQAIAAQPFDGHTQELERIDAEERAIKEALNTRKTLEELLGSGVSARCTICGELISARAEFCSNCGAATRRPSPAPEAHPPAARPSHTAAPAAVVTGASSGRSPTPPAR
jgi:hypothetical protein